MTEVRDSILVSPGPVHVDPLRWRAVRPVHHRSEAFRRIVVETESMARELLRAAQQDPVYAITSSGTGAMEATIANLTRPGTTVLVVSGGKFGDRWAEICNAYGCVTDVMRYPDGRAVDVGEIAARAAQTRPQVCAVTHVESSTGLLLPLKEIARSLPEPRPILIVDAVSSAGAEELEMEAWGLDAVVFASQKAFAAPAGVGFICLGPRAVPLAREAARSLYYFSFARFEEGRGRGDTPFTPAVHTLQMVHGSLEIMRRIGWDAVRERYRLTAEAFLEAARNISLEPLPERPSSAVQALVLPEPCRQGGFVAELALKYGVYAADGQGALRGRIVRTGFLGLYGSRTLRRVVSAMADIVERKGCEVDRGSVERALSRIAEEKDIFTDLT